MNWKDTQPILEGRDLVIVGDTHLSSKYQGTHINYIETSYLTMQHILRLVKKHKKSNGKVALVLLGDLFGVKERNIHDDQFFDQVYTWFYSLNVLCDGHVYSVKGNHDMGVYTTFDLMVNMGLLKNPKFIDFCTDKGDLEGRFHIVNYGQERAELDYPDNSEAANFVLGHADYSIKGVTAWYDSPSQVEVATLENFKDVSAIISGHIHTPQQPYTVDMPDGNRLQLFFPGAPSRVTERFPDCFYVYFSYDRTTGDTNFDTELMGLRPIDEEFIPESEIITKDTAEETYNLDGIEEILGTLSSHSTVEGNIINQIRQHQGASEQVREKAVEFLEKVL